MNATEFVDKARQYGRAHRMLPWMIGDLLNQFVESRGEEAWQYVEEFGVSRDVLRDYSFIADIFDQDNRLDYELSIWYFREVATLPGATAHYFLGEAMKHGWSSKDLRAQVRQWREDRKNSVRLSGVESADSVSG